MKARKVKLSELKPAPDNARLHPEANLEAIAASLEAYGQVEPIIVQAGTNQIIGGHGRLEALKSLGRTTAYIVEIEANDLEAAGMAVALNRTAELGQWDRDSLEAVLRNAETPTGFDDSEVSELLGSGQIQTAPSEIRVKCVIGRYRFTLDPTELDLCVEEITARHGEENITREFARRLGVAYSENYNTSD